MVSSMSSISSSQFLAVWSLRDDYLLLYKRQTTPILTAQLCACIPQIALPVIGNFHPFMRICLLLAVVNPIDLSFKMEKNLQGIMAR